MERYRIIELFFAFSSVGKGTFGRKNEMNKADLYLQAGTRENTRRSYRAAVEHFEVTWGGFLPTTGDGIVRYLAEYADKHTISTLKQRLAALAQWHITKGFPDPTKTPAVRQKIKGIRALHPAQEKQAAPLLQQHLAPPPFVSAFLSCICPTVHGREATSGCRYVDPHSRLLIVCADAAKCAGILPPPAKGLQKSCPPGIALRSENRTTAF